MSHEALYATAAVMTLSGIVVQLASLVQHRKTTDVSGLSAAFVIVELIAGMLYLSYAVLLVTGTADNKNGTGWAMLVSSVIFIAFGFAILVLVIRKAKARTGKIIW